MINLFFTKGINGNNFYQQIRVTADGRWFDNSGFPIDPPAKVEDEEEKNNKATFVKMELTEEEKAEQARYQAEEEKKMLSKLK